MDFTPTAIADVVLVTPHPRRDERGFFMEMYRAEAFERAGITATLVQENYSGSRKGVLRGLHYQVRQPQGKLVHVVVGEVYDVAVDLRRSSPSFGRYVGVHLSAENMQQIWIPPGFAHGFYVLSEWAEVTYKVTDYYAPDWDRTLLWSDPKIGIAWPLIEGLSPPLSPKDAQGKTIDEAELFD